MCNCEKCHGENYSFERDCTWCTHPPDEGEQAACL